MKRFNQVFLLVSFAGFSWLGMQAVHELGHVAAALVTGGSVERVVLHPLAISRTDVYPNPSPLAVVWAGPLVGTVLPLAVFLAMNALRVPGSYIARAFAGFCLVANGAYIGADVFAQKADAADLIRHGAHSWQLMGFSLTAISLGLYLWHGLGCRFGFGSARGVVSQRAARAVCFLFMVMVGIGLSIHGFQSAGP